MWKCFLIIGLIFAFISCDDTSGKNKVPEVPPITTQGNNSDIVNYGIGGIINEYYLLKDNFVLENEAMIMQHAIAMQKGIDTLDLTTVQGTDSDKSKVKKMVSEIDLALVALLHEKEIETQRKPFQTISDKLYDLIKSVRFDKQIIYHEHCPMAFKETGANWLSNTPEIKNPYIPKKMIDCGDVLDTLDFTKPE